MMTVTITRDFTLPIPAPLRRLFPAGQEVAISTDTQGRLIITPIEQVRAVLMETFGMWADRADLPPDSLDIMDEMRRGLRLNEMGLPLHETH